MMEFVDKLLQETDYLKLLNRLAELERERPFCCHGLEHLLDTARIAWIRKLEAETAGQWKNIEKEQLYLAALLHDLGRIREYQEGIPHHEASVAMAQTLLEEIDYPREKAEEILKAISGHRGRQQEEDGALAKLLAWADKQSRNCFYCEAQSECNWTYEKRNHRIQY